MSELHGHEVCRYRVYAVVVLDYVALLPEQVKRDFRGESPEINLSPGVWVGSIWRSLWRWDLIPSVVALGPKSVPQDAFSSSSDEYLFLSHFTKAFFETSQ